MPMPKQPCKHCGEDVEINKREQHLRDRHPEVLPADVTDPAEVKEIITASFIYKTPKGEPDAEKGRTDESGELGGGELAGKGTEIDAALPPGDFFAAVMRRYRDAPWGLKVSDEELTVFREEYNADGRLPHPSKVEQWLVEGGLCRKEKAFRIAGLYQHLAQEYLNKKAALDRRYDIPRPEIGLASAPSTNPHIFDLKEPRGGEMHASTGFSGFSQPAPNLRDPGYEPRMPTTDEIVAVMIPQIRKIVQPLEQRIRQFELGGDGSGVLEEERGMAAPSVTHPLRVGQTKDPELEVIKEKLKTTEDTLAKLLSNQEEEKKQREKEREKKEFLDSVAKTVDNRISALVNPLKDEVSELRRLSTTGGLPPGMDSKSWLDFFGVKRDKDLNERKFEFEATKWDAEQKADQDWKKTLADTLKGAGDLIGEIAGDTVYKQLKRKTASGAESYRVPELEGQSMIAIPCPKCGHPIKAAKDAKMVTCVNCQPPTVWELVPELGGPAPIPEKNEGKKEPVAPKGKIRILDERTGEPVTEFQMPP